MQTEVQTFGFRAQFSRPVPRHRLVSLQREAATEEDESVYLGGSNSLLIVLLILLVQTRASRGSVSPPLLSSDRLFAFCNRRMMANSEPSALLICAN